MTPVMLTKSDSRQETDSEMVGTKEAEIIDFFSLLYFANSVAVK